MVSTYTRHKKNKDGRCYLVKETSEYVGPCPDPTHSPPRQRASKKKAGNKK